MQCKSLWIKASAKCININVNVNRLENDVGIRRSALAWFKSYVSDHHQFVAVNEEVSYESQVQYGVPQGSRSLTFHTLRYPWEISLGNMVLAFTVMLMILSSIFFRDPMKHTNLQN